MRGKGVGCIITHTISGFVSKGHFCHSVPIIPTDQGVKTIVKYSSVIGNFGSSKLLVLLIKTQYDYNEFLNRNYKFPGIVIIVIHSVRMELNVWLSGRR